MENEIRKERIEKAKDIVLFACVAVMIIGCVLLMLSFEPFGFLGVETKLNLLYAGGICVISAVSIGMFGC